MWTPAGRRSARRLSVRSGSTSNISSVMCARAKYWKGLARPYPLTPVEFYADIVEATGLIPVFVGQTAPNLYTDRLRARFPQGVFLETGDVVLDFQTIRQAKNIAFGVSTFGWLAAWLSHADRIFMAVNGLFNPMHYWLADLLPFGDARYRFYLFPINYPVPLEHHAAAHQRIAPYWRLVPHALLQRMIREAPRFDPPAEQMLEEFDAQYYLAANPDLLETLGAGNWEGARQHYRQSGVRERRLPFRLSPTWYAARYPTAAFEVAQGDYSSFAHHYVAVGRDHGYRPLPDAGDITSSWCAGTDEPAIVALPSIAVLAREVVWLEQGGSLRAAEVSLGDSFATLLPADAAKQFAAQTTTEPMRTYRLRDVVLDPSIMALFSGRRPIQETLYLVSQDDYDYALEKPLHPEPTNAQRHYILGGNVSAHNYYHWMTQSLPAIDWGLRNRQQRDAVLALPLLQPWQEASLALLGHADAPRLTLQPTWHYRLASAEYAEFLGDRMTRVVSRAASVTFARLRQAVAPTATAAARSTWRVPTQPTASR